jgi:hypothetical protein
MIEGETNSPAVVIGLQTKRRFTSIGSNNFDDHLAKSLAIMTP